VASASSAVRSACTTWSMLASAAATVQLPITW
jgi:hypothetical protein